MLRDERLKLLNVGLWQTDAVSGGEAGRGADALFADLLPRVAECRRAQGRLDRRVALLRQVEALRLFAAAHPLLDAQPDGVAYRLLGVAATELGPAGGADEDDMFVRDSGREKTREAAIATLRDRFGPLAVQRGLTFRPDSSTK